MSSPRLPSFQAFSVQLEIEVRRARATRRVIAGLDDVEVAGVRRLAPAAAVAELAPPRGPRHAAEPRPGHADLGVPR